MQTMLTLVDEIRRLTAILAEYKALYFVQMKERELAGKQYVERNFLSLVTSASDVLLHTNKLCSVLFFYVPAPRNYSLVR